MASALRNIAPELQLTIADALISSSGGHTALCEWSCTCSFYRNLLAPYIFKTVSLHNDEECASTLLRIARSPYKEHVKNLVYTGFASSYVRDHVDFPTVHHVFPHLVNEVLSELRRFPCLNSVTITFPMDEDKWERSLQESSWNKDLTDIGEVAKAEMNDVGRSLMQQTYESLSQNVDHHVTALELRHLPSCEVSTFSSRAFQRFLRSLQQFTLSFPGHDVLQLYLNTYESHLLFVSKLDLFFFEHLHNVLEFVLKASMDGLIGLQGFRYSKLALSAHHMPRLRILHLEYIFICPELVDFLRSKSGTLESVSLHECLAGSGPFSVAENAIRWQVLFKALLDSKPSRLSRFLVTPPDPAAAEYEGEIDESTALQVSEVAKIYPERRMFHYAYLEEEYAYMSDDIEESIEAFLEGEDQRTYEELMEIINANASRASKS